VARPWNENSVTRETASTMRCISVKVEAEKFAAFQRLANKRGLPLSALMRELIEIELRQHGDEDDP
jgi:predicted DNA binding CopG/RHH family protein